MSAPSPCAACGSSADAAVPQALLGYSLAACRRCGLRWLENPPSGETLAALYSSGFYEPGPARMRGVAERGHAFNNAVRMRELRGLAIGRLLDVGSGRGRFLGAAKAAGWEVVGIELEPGMATASSRQYGIDVVVGDAVGADVSGPFDVVTMWHVLEHVPEPRSALDRAFGLLRPGGTLIVSVPNNDSFQARLGGDDWLHLDVPRHLYHFNPGSLTRLVEQSGFEVQRVGHFYPEMEVLGVMQTFLNKLGVEPDLLYRFAKRDRTVRLSPAVILSMMAAAAMLPIALVWAMVAPILRSGASIQLVARRPGP